MEHEQYKHLIKIAFNEDLGINGDITSLAVFKDEVSDFVLYSKDRGILAGLEVFIACFHEMNREIEVNTYYQDGDALEPGCKVAEVKGKVVAVLSAERVALNFLSTLSGIATRTREYVLAAGEGGKAVILDTRKTLPGYRYISKYAVQVGGGRNHRMGLYDMVLIKDNHIDAAGSITKAVNLVRKHWNSKFKIEVECRNLKDIEEALACRVDVIMLDNMETDQIREAVAFVNGRTELEASGNMTPEMTRVVSGTGVDYISAGAITKSVTAFDFSLKKG